MKNDLRKARARKLQLNRETLGTLDMRDLVKVIGGNKPAYTEDEGYTCNGDNTCVDC